MSKVTSKIRPGRPGLHLGSVLEDAAVKKPHTRITLDHALDALPGAGPDLTTAQLAELVDDLAARLHAAGLRKGDYVAIHKRHNFDIYLLACAASRLGAVAALLSPKLDGPVVTELLRRLGRPFLITDAAKMTGSLADQPIREITKGIINAAGELPDAVALADLAGAPRQPRTVLPDEHPALLTHTSGTTGIPKLVVHNARSLRGRWRPQQKLMAMVRKRETVAIHVSFVHSRLFLAMAVLLPKGLPVVVIDDASPEAAAEIFLRLRPGFLETHPNTFMEWEELADDPRGPLESVKYFSSTFDAIHPGTIKRLLDASGRRAPLFWQLYGQSETGPVVGRGYTARRAVTANGRCLGVPMPGVTRIRVVPRNGQPVTEQTPGYIEVLTQGRALTYHGEQERYDKMVQGEWWRMGDVGYRTKAGCLHLLDREVDLIPGMTSTLAAEDQILAHLHELTELVFVPGEDDRPVPVLSTRKDEPLDPYRWAAAAKGLVSLADPVQLRLEDFPRTATSKIKRLELAAALRNGGLRTLQPTER